MKRSTRNALTLLAYAVVPLAACFCVPPYPAKGLWGMMWGLVCAAVCVFCWGKQRKKQ